MDEVAEYLYLTANERDRNRPSYVFKETAREVIYQQCLRSFQYNEYVNDAQSALDDVRRGTFGEMVKKRVQKAHDEKARAKKEAERQEKIENLKRECQKNGLDFRKEKKKLLKELKKKEKESRSLTTIILTIIKSLLLISGVVFAISLVLMDKFENLTEALTPVAAISLLLTIATGWFLYRYYKE